MTKQTVLKQLKEFWAGIYSYFNIKGDIEPQNDIETSIRAGISFKGSQLLTLIFAIFIASLGLNTNSVPVIIGAMLISPLMGPIIGMGLGIGIHDLELIKRSLKNISAAVLGSLLTSAIYFAISPLYDGASQLLARTSPSIYDVFVALFGGAAGILSIAAKNKGQVLPGVAIATSLMPPLCTAGYGIATLQMHFFLGALYLFFTNMIFIFFATWIGVKLMGFKRTQYQNEKKAYKIKIIAYSVILATVGVSIYLTTNMLNNNIFLEKANRFVESQMNFPNTQVLNHKEFISNGKKQIDVTLIGEALPIDSLQLAMITKLDSAGLSGTILNIKQGFSLSKDNFDSKDSQVELYEMLQNEIARRYEEVDSLQKIINSRQSSIVNVEALTPELRILFPKITNIAMGSFVSSPTDSLNLNSVEIFFIRTANVMSEKDRIKIEDFIRLRLNDKRMKVIMNPQAFPWNN